MSPTPPELDAWITELAPRLGINVSEVPTHVILDVARDVAHGAVRPGAPVSAFMIGLALGLGNIATPEQGAEAVAETLAAWSPDAPGASESTAPSADGGAATSGGEAGDVALAGGADAVDRVESLREADAAGIAGETDGGAA